MRDLWLKLAYSNIWIAMAAGGQVYVNCRLLGAPAQTMPMLLATLAMFWVYTFAKAVHFDPKADQANDPERTAFLRAHRWPLTAFGLLGLVAGSYLAWHHSGLTLTIFWSPTLIGLLYDLNLLPKSFRYRRLKDIFGLKGTSVALAWSVLAVGLVHSYGVTATLDQWIFLAWWNATMWLINTTYFDLGDIGGDRLEGTRTLPVVIGFCQTRRLLHLLNALAALSLLGATWAGWVQPLGARLLALNLVQAVLLYRAKDEDTDIGWECDIVFDGIFVFAALSLML
jgi:4-hydroxybenzoate polyprenyltransferase